MARAWVVPNRKTLGVGAIGGLLLLVLATVLSQTLTPTGSGASSFLETFDGTPAAPLPAVLPTWDVNPSGYDSRQNGTTAQQAHHGSDCAAPGFPYTATNSHPMVSQDSMVFICNGHLMTATGLTGYGAVYLVPPALADFSQGTSVIKWDMSTLRTSARDWVYLTLMPFEGHNKFAYNNNDTNVPPNNVNITMNAGPNVFIGSQRVNNQADVRFGTDSSTTWDQVQAANGVVAVDGTTESAARRDSFEIDISATHLRMCLVGNNTGQVYTYQGRSPFCWIDQNLPTPLDPNIWHGQAVVMITHVAYNPEKACQEAVDQFSIGHSAYGDANCPPDTWHWDNVSINPAQNFSILNPTQRYAAFNDPSASNTINFATPAPANARLSFIGFGGDCSSQQRFSINGGQTWITAIPVPATVGQCNHQDIAGEFWTPIPAGTRSVRFTGTRGFAGWGVEDPAIWAAGTASVPASTTTPTSPATPFPVPTLSSTPPPTAPPSPTAVLTSATPTPTSLPTPTSTLTTCESMVRVGGVVMWAPQPSAFCAGAHP